jgi:RNA polymerase sigma factor (sigma-70 family)
VATEVPASYSEFRLLMHTVESTGAGPQPAREVFSFAGVPCLTAALKRGDETAFAWLHGEWSGRINRYCFALAHGDEVLAGEIAQGTWLRLVKHIRVIRDEPALWSWIACAARHAATDLRRKGGRYVEVLRRFAEWWPSVAKEADADEGLLAALETALSQLGDDERGLIEARYFAGETLEVIGTRHALSVRAVEGRLARLRVRLRDLVAKEIKLHVQ